jgi:hypothetical protein
VPPVRKLHRQQLNNNNNGFNGIFESGMLEGGIPVAWLHGTLRQTCGFDALLPLNDCRKST